MILALDYGDRYIGIAITDPDGVIALRHSMIDGKNEDSLAKLKDIVEDERVTKIVVGVPISLSGKDTEQTHKTRQFIEVLGQELGDSIGIEGVDETLTSVEAQQNLLAEGGNKEDEHMEAARIILESYLKL